MKWVITVYLKGNLSMFEFNSEKEAKEAFNKIHGCKILTEVINYHNPSYALVAV
jgi:ArsR family metal-binding transcriptional regulator